MTAPKLRGGVANVGTFAIRFTKISPIVHLKERTSDFPALLQ